MTKTPLADEDTKSIQTDDANREIQENVSMQVAPFVLKSLPKNHIVKNWKTLHR